MKEWIKDIAIALIIALVIVQFVKPTIGAVTSIGPQHLSTFGSQENITKEKMQEASSESADRLSMLSSTSHHSWSTRTARTT